MDARTQDTARRVAAGERELAPRLIAALTRAGEKEEAREAFKALLEEDLETLAADGDDRALEEQQRRQEQAQLGEGRKVRYTKGKTGRARARFNESGETVPKGTEGIVTWLGPVSSYRSRYGTWTYGTSQKVRVEVAGGDSFTTYTRNLKLLDSWEDVDIRQRKALRAAETEAEQWQMFARPERGSEVTMIDQNGLEVTGACFWVGEDRRAVGALQGVAWRLGLRETPNAAPKWGSGAKVLRINGARTPQAELLRKRTA